MTSNFRYAGYAKCARINDLEPRISPKDKVYIRIYGVIRGIDE